MRRAFLSVLLLVSAFLFVPASPATAAPYCGLVWGSLEKSASGLPAGGRAQGRVVNVRTGQHACYDRFVVDVDGAVGGYTARYVPHVVQDASGALIPTRGGAALQITVQAPAYTHNAVPTYRPADPLELTNVARYRPFRQVVLAGTFEGYTSVGIGVRARLPYRVLVLDGPGTGSRVVVDVAHRW
ncbi:AMIN-like domain-containing (lipo)protein [Cellulomonas sp. ICMP 17802]|uniref:AMIN-like domain-containing (lipo)protein n=1 Tax=Cellulomonas sp. ICMP 17802 TaxID=3239199 RepID=UPI00351B2A2B